MLDYIKTLAIMIAFVAGFVAIVATMAEIRNAASEDSFYENQF